MYKVGLLIIVVCIIILDQVSKLYFNSVMSYGVLKELIPGYFGVTLLYNLGAAFSFLHDAGGWQKYLFTLIALLVCIWLTYGIVKDRFSRLMNLSAVCIIGGALGNVIDRLIHGHVIDFIQVHYQTHWFYPAFNIADSFICIGAVLMVLDGFGASRRR